jgi:hypothetical protein
VPEEACSGAALWPIRTRASPATPRCPYARARASGPGHPLRRGDRRPEPFPATSGLEAPLTRTTLTRGPVWTRLQKDRRPPSARAWRPGSPRRDPTDARRLPRRRRYAGDLYAGHRPSLSAELLGSVAFAVRSCRGTRRSRRDLPAWASVLTAAHRTLPNFPTQCRRRCASDERDHDGTVPRQQHVAGGRTRRLLWL